MGKRGPQPTPAAILEQRGSWRAKDRQETRAIVTIPRMDASLFDAVAAAKWESMVEHLAAIGVLSFVDEHAISRYCVTWSLWRQAIESLKRRGAQVFPIRNEAGDVVDVKPFPEVAIAARYFDQLMRMEDRFGLSPASRASIRTQIVMDMQPKEVQAECPDAPKDKSRFFN